MSQPSLIKCKVMKVNSSDFKASVFLHILPIISPLFFCGGVLPCPTYILTMFHTFSPSASPSRILKPGLRQQNSMNRKECSIGLSTAAPLWLLRSKLDEYWSESACHKFNDQSAQSHPTCNLCSRHCQKRQTKYKKTTSHQFRTTLF